MSSSVRVNFARARRMDLDELVSRSRQEIWKRLDRSVQPQQKMPDIQATLNLEHFRSIAPARFFEGAVNSLVPRLLAERRPGARDDLLAEGEALLQGRFDLLGYRALSFGEVIDWHLNPITGHRAPLVHWSRFDSLVFSEAGDCKVVWELNRHQWMVRLGQVYRLTGDERYADAVAAHLWHWMGANPTGVGINWTASLEVSYRLIAWCWCLFLFQGSPALSSELFEVILGQIWAHARRIERYLSHYSSPNTHLTGEALGLFYAGQVFQELPRSERWSTLAAQILSEECERQILPDGVYFEQSTGYQRYTLEIYLHYLILAARNGLSVAPAVAERVESMLDFTLGLRLPDGSLPPIGDADSGTLVPFARRGQCDFGGVLSTAAAFFRRPDCAWAAGVAAPDVMWLLGPEAARTFDELRPSPPAAGPSRLFAEGGYAVMRSDWAPDGQMLTFDVGPLGCPVSAGHGHADLLSVQCAVAGERFLVDAGTYCYAGDSLARNFFRGTAAHSTVMVDGEPQTSPTGPFQWSERPSARLRNWCSTPAFDFADAEHQAYQRLPGCVVHRRRVMYVKARYWVIVDDLNGAGEHHVDLRFQFAPIDVTLDGKWASAWGPARTHGLMLRPFSVLGMAASIHCGEQHPMQGWVAGEYGQRQPAPLLSYAARVVLPFRVMTILVPVRRGDRAPAVWALRRANQEPIGLAFETGERIHFDGVDTPTLEHSA